MEATARSLSTAWDLWRAGRGTPAAVARRRRVRLAAIFTFARTHSPYYRALYSGLPERPRRLTELPPVTKSELRAQFDAVVTDPAVTWAAVNAFVADGARSGALYRGRYAVWRTSGTTGEAGIFLHDQGALRVYSLLVALRYWAPLMTPRRAVAFLGRGVRVAAVLATGAPFAGISYWRQTRRQVPWLARRLRIFSLQASLPDLVRELNDFRPTVLAGYPTALALLAEEQLAGRLHIHPALLGSGAECLAPRARAALTSAFGCPLRDTYSASEFMHMAFECALGRLHVNADWLILEAVDAHYAPTPAGQPSHTVLLTNLVNRVQPLIRYDLGDSVTVLPDPCPCGSPLPAIHVTGRQDEVLRLCAPGGATVGLSSLAIITLVDPIPGVQHCQIIQTGPATLRIRLATVPGAEPGAVWERLTQQLRAYLAAQGLSGVAVTPAPEPPQPEPRSGKFRRVWAALSPPSSPPASPAPATQPITESEQKQELDET